MSTRTATAGSTLATSSTTMHADIKLRPLPGSMLVRISRKSNVMLLTKRKEKGNDKPEEKNKNAESISLSIYKPINYRYTTALRETTTAKNPDKYRHQNLKKNTPQKPAERTRPQVSPPNSSGASTPIRPCSNNPETTAGSMVLSVSISRTRGPITSAANLETFSPAVSQF